MRRFFISPHCIHDNGLVVMDDQEAHHIANVLRLRVGEQVELFDGTGAIYSAHLTSIHRREVQAQIDQMEPGPLAPQFPLTLMQALVKGKKMDLILQKATELGVEECILFPTEYCATKKEVQNQMERWHRIVLEACKQCRRPVPMRIRLENTLTALDLSSYTYPLLAYEQEHTNAPIPLADTPGSICVLIGPEGGWHEHEVNYLLNQNVVPISLGPYILRAETAAITACSLLTYLSRTAARNK